MNNSQEGTFTCPSGNLFICTFQKYSKICTNLERRHLTVTINGNQTTFSTDLTVAEYLEQNNYQTNRIVVELNEEILPKYLYSETRLKDGDSMEIVTFVGGG